MWVRFPPGTCVINRVLEPIYRQFCGSFRRLLHAFSGAGAVVFGVWRLKPFIRTGANIRYEFGLSGVRINCMPLPITVNDDCQLLGAGFERFHRVLLSGDSSAPVDVELQDGLNYLSYF